MIKNQKEILGLFRIKEDIDRCVKKLRDEDYLASDISVVIPNPEAGSPSRFLDDKNLTLAPETALIGLIIGALVGFSVGGLLGSGLLTVPGLSYFKFQSPLITSIIGLITMGLSGGLIGGLIGRMIPSDDSKGYERSLRAGEILISVRTTEVGREREAMTIMREMGSKNIIVKDYRYAGIGERPIAASGKQKRMTEPHSAPSPKMP